MNVRVSASIKFSTGSSPNQQTISVHFMDSMKRDIHGLTGLILQLKRKPVSFLEVHFPQRNSNESLRDMVDITDFEGSRSEFPIPADSV